MRRPSGKESHVRHPATPAVTLFPETGVRVAPRRFRGILYQVAENPTTSPLSTVEPAPRAARFLARRNRFLPPAFRSVPLSTRSTTRIETDNVHTLPAPSR